MPGNFADKVRREYSLKDDLAYKEHKKQKLQNKSRKQRLKTLKKEILKHVGWGYSFYSYAINSFILEYWPTPEDLSKDLDGLSVEHLTSLDGDEYYIITWG